MSYTVGGLRLDRPFRIRRIGHFGYHSPDITATVEFLTKRVGLLVSDIDDFTSRAPQLEKLHATGWFLRCGSDHHTIVVASQKLVDAREPARKGAVVGQLSWQVGSLQEVLDGIGYLEGRAKLRRVGRDTPGSNWHGYVYDPDGYINEVFYGMEQIGWDGRSKPVTMYDRGFTTLPPLPQPPEFREVDEALSNSAAAGGYRWQETEPLDYTVEGMTMPRPYKPTRLGRIVLFVADLEASLAFYRDAMGLKLTERVRVKGHECAFLRVDDEHHTLVLVPKKLREGASFGADLGAGYGLAVPTFDQLRAAYRVLREQGYRELDLPPELSAGVHYGFWLQSPDKVAVQLYYAMDRVGRDGAAPIPTTLPTPAASWPEAIVHGGPAWYDPPFMGPLA